ncbi:hypothetical protein VTN02DRAFT_121 [Thermoascus thermophilus]
MQALAGEQQVTRGLRAPGMPVSLLLQGPGCLSLLLPTFVTSRRWRRTSGRIQVGNHFYYLDHYY